MNVTEAMVDILKKASGVSALVGDRVFGTELPDDQGQKLSRRCVVVSASGGAGAGAGSRSRAHWIPNRLDAKCYGKTPYEADQVHNAVYRVMTQLERTVVGDVAVMDAVVAGGPLPGRDGDADWPYTLGVYMVNAIYK